MARIDDGDSHRRCRLAADTGSRSLRFWTFRPGPIVGKVKAALTDAVVAGDLAPDDVAGAERLAREVSRAS